MTEFNLIEDPWIPCIDGSGRTIYLGIHETLSRSKKLREIDHPSPLVTASLHRLLIALIHRTHGPKDNSVWMQLWRKGAWNDAELEAYLDRWHDRFELLNGSHRFYQSALATGAQSVPISKIVLERASGNNTTLFDHTPTETPLSAAEAACYLVSAQAYAVGGLMTPTPGVASSRSARDSHLIRGAMGLVRGRDLFETLMLNLCDYDCRHDLPYRMDPSDRPAWEVDTAAPAERYPLGWLDLLTWQSRRVLLHAEGSHVTRVTLLMGDTFPSTWHPKDMEMMIAYQKNPKAVGLQDPYPAIGISEERALWRDSRSLFASVDGGRGLGIVEFLAKRQDALATEQVFPVDLMGLSKDQAKLLLWRHERVDLPLRLVAGSNNSGSALEALRIALDAAESAGDELRKAMDNFATVLLQPAGARTPSRKEVRALRTTLYREGQYWHRLDAPFTEFLYALAKSRSKTDEHLSDWIGKVVAAAKGTFTEVVTSLGGSPRVLKADSQATPSFHAGLRKLGSVAS